MNALAIEVRNGGRRVRMDPATGEWILERDGQVVIRSRDKQVIEQELEAMDHQA